MGVVGGGIAGGAIGAAVGWAAPALSGLFSGSLVLAGGGTVSTGVAVAGVGLLAVNVWFAKDRYVRELERGMSEYQKEMFQREIEDTKYMEGRGGADNLPKKILEEIAKMIKRLYK